jgi:hypothetical protein
MKIHCSAVYLRTILNTNLHSAWTCELPITDQPESLQAEALCHVVQIQNSGLSCEMDSVCLQCSMVMGSLGFLTGCS